MQRDGVEIQFRDPNAKRSAPQLEITSWYREVRLSKWSPGAKRER